MTSNHYDVLGVGTTFTPAELKAAYRKAVRHAHPDTGGSAAAFQAVQDAYACLSDDLSRRAYDATRSRQSPTGDPSAPGGASASATSSDWGTTSRVRPTSTPPAGPGPVPPPARTEPTVAQPSRQGRRRKLATLNRALVPAWVSAGVLALVALAATTVGGQAGWSWVLLVGVPAMIWHVARRGESARALGVLVAMASLSIIVLMASRGVWQGLFVVWTVSAIVVGFLARRANRPVGQRTRSRAWRRGGPASQWDRVLHLAEGGASVWFVVQADAVGRGAMAATAAILAAPDGSERILKLLDGIHEVNTWVVLNEAGDVVFTTTENARAAWEARAAGVR